MSSLPTSQKAAIVLEQRGASVVQDRSIPTPKEGELLVKILSAAINPVDAKIRDYKFVIPGYPAILGSDAAGEVVAVGGGEAAGSKHSFIVGDRVFFQGNYASLDTAAFQQYAVVPADLAGLTPKNVSNDAASTLNVCGLAATIGLYHPTGGVALSPLPWEAGGDIVGKGSAIVVLGGSSSVGQFVIQLARESGFTRIITASSPQHHDHLSKLGATHILDRNHASEKDYVDATSSAPLPIVFDTISSPATQAQAVKIFQTKYPPSSNSTAKKNIVITTFVDAKAKEEGTSEGIGMNAVLAAGALPHLRKLASSYFAELGGDHGWLAKGTFVPNTPLVVPGGLGAVNEALQKVEKGVSGVKVVINP